jgi:capsular exopolysaccharide synthesis family protein
MRDGNEVPSKQAEALALTRWNDNFSLAAEAYRNATFSILLSDSSKRSRSYVVSSPSAGEGKTTVTSNLGVALSKSKMRVVLVDGDLRKPKLHNAFGLQNDFGMRNILRGELDLEKTPTSVLTKRTALPNLSIIPAGLGAEDIVELLHSPYLGGLLARLSKDFDVILIDTPPTLYMADVRIFAGQTDGAILVFRAGITTREEAGNARDLFDHDGVRLVGTILNDFDPVREGKAGYYHSYYRYQQGLENNEDLNKVAANL